MSQYRIKNKSRKGKVKYRKKKSAWKSPAFRITLWTVILVILLGYLLLLSPLLAIKEIRVSAPAALNNIAPEIKDLVNKELEGRFILFSIRKTFFLLDTQTLKNKIKEAEPAIENVVIKKEFFNTLSLELKNRTPQAVWCYEQNENCYLIDKNGVIFEETREKNFPMITSEETPSTKLPDEVITSDKMSQILEILTFFNDNLKIAPQSLLTDTREKLTIKTQEGWEVYFLLGGDIKTGLTKLGLLMEKTLTPDKRKDLQYIDLRFSKVYYK